MYRQKSLLDIIHEESLIFKNRDVFNLNYIPDIYQYRDSQLDSMIFYSRKLKSGIVPFNMELEGKNATGKTTTLKKYFQIITEFFDNIIPVYINCQIYRTEYEIFSKIYKTLFNEEISVAGLSTFDIYNKIMNKLANSDLMMIVGLDDYDNIKNSKELNKTLYSLLKAHESFYNVQISIINVVSKDNLNLYVDSNISTLYLPIEINFPFYDENQIYHILKQRVDLGFYPNVLSEDLLEQLAIDTYYRQNIRYGIHKLAIAGDKAEFRGSNIIEADDFH